MRGFGGSDAPERVEEYDILKLTGDVVGILDALEEDTAVVVGHDWGRMWRGIARYFIPNDFAP